MAYQADVRVNTSQCTVLTLVIFVRGEVNPIRRMQAQAAKHGVDPQRVVTDLAMGCSSVRSTFLFFTSFGYFFGVDKAFFEATGFEEVNLLEVAEC